MASSDVAKVRVVGRGGHGSTPQLAADPVPALAEITTALNTMVTRRFDVQNPVVVTVGLLQAGTIANVIPEEGRLEATLRTFDTEVRSKLIGLIPEVVAGIASAHGVRGEFELLEQYPVTVNDDAEADVVASAVTDLFGEHRHLRWENPLAGAEDFSRLLQEAAGCFIGLSACPPDLDPLTAPFNHSAYARFDDAVVPDGAALFTELTLRKLGA